MDKLSVVRQKSDCTICSNKENNITQTTINLEKLLENCEEYLDTSIIIKSFDEDSPISCCSYCYESTHQLILVKEQVEKVQKKISALILFSKNILERRIEENQSTEETTPSADNCVGICKNVNPFCSTTETYNVNVQEFIESPSKEVSPHSDSQFENSELGGFITDPLLDTDEHEINTEYKCDIDIYSEDELDSYDDEAVSINTFDFDTTKKIVVPNQLSSAAVEHGDDQAEKTSKTNLLMKCLKTPILQLERLPLYMIRSSSNTVYGADEENIKCERASSELDNDSETVSKDENFKCREVSCSKSYKRKQDLMRHQKSHSAEKPYKCSFCSKSFAISSNLKKHERIHSEERPFQCSLCPKSFKISGYLIDHQRVHSDKKPFKCSFCPKSFRISGNLKSHEITHTEERPYICLEISCSKSFQYKSALNAHRKVHSGERPFLCSICSKTFKTLRYLQDHEIIHSGDKPYKCSEISCSKSFISNNQLIKHQRIHSGERPYLCCFCSKTFKCNTELKNHERRIHTSERPYKCGICSKTFKLKWDVDGHQSAHSEDRPYKCSVCFKSYKRSSHLNTHKRTHSGEGDNTTAQTI